MKPAVPYPPEADLRRYPHLPLYVQRLRDSRLVALASPEEFRAWMLLLCAAWHQVPAGSLPADERELAYLIHCSAADWQAIGPMKLHGWVEHRDGRLYNSVLTAEVERVVADQRRNRNRTQNARDAKASKNQGVTSVTEGIPADASGILPPEKEKEKEKDTDSNATHYSPGVADHAVGNGHSKPQAWPEGKGEWLRDFLTTCDVIPFPRDHLIDFSWWFDVSKSINGLPNTDYLTRQFSRMSAWLAENPKRRPAGKSASTKRFVRGWLERDYEKERRRKA